MWRFIETMTSFTDLLTEDVLERKKVRYRLFSPIYTVRGFQESTKALSCAYTHPTFLSLCTLRISRFCRFSHGTLPDWLGREISLECTASEGVIKFLLHNYHDEVAQAFHHWPGGNSVGARGLGADQWAVPVSRPRKTWELTGTW